MLIDHQSASIHEASHAIIALSVGCHVRGCSISPDGSGRTSVDFLDAFSQAADTSRRLFMVSLAGSMGASLFRGTDSGSAEDMRLQIEGMAGLSRAGISTRRLRRQVKTLLLKHSEWIETVADALDSGRTLTGAEIVGMRKV